MKTATVTEIKKELQFRSTEEVQQLCLRLSKFKKENKELLTYLLFEASDEETYIQGVKDEIDTHFKNIHHTNFYYIKKSVRKVLRETKKYIRYSQKKETEVELLLYFCEQLKNFRPSIQRNTTLKNIYDRQLDFIEKKIDALHEDLQYDYTLEIAELRT